MACNTQKWSFTYGSDLTWALFAKSCIKVNLPPCDVIGCVTFFHVLLIYSLSPSRYDCVSWGPAAKHLLPSDYLWPTGAWGGVKVKWVSRVRSERVSAKKITSCMQLTSADDKKRTIVITGQQAKSGLYQIFGFMKMCNGRLIKYRRRTGTIVALFVSILTR